MQAAVKRIRSNGAIYQSFPDVPAVNEWLACFAADMLRYPFSSFWGRLHLGRQNSPKVCSLAHSSSRSAVRTCSRPRWWSSSVTPMMQLSSLMSATWISSSNTRRNCRANMIAGSSLPQPKEALASTPSTCSRCRV